MTVRENQGHLRELYAVDVSPDLISRVGVHWNLPSSGEPHMRSSPSSSRTACRLNRRRSTLHGAFAHILSDTLPKFVPAVVVQPEVDPTEWTTEGGFLVGSRAVPFF
jgi:hypothetical protein